VLTVIYRQAGTKPDRVFLFFSVCCLSRVNMSRGIFQKKLRQTKLNKSTILLVFYPHMSETLNVTNKLPRRKTKALFKH